MLDGLEWIVPLNAAGEQRSRLDHLFVERNPLSNSHGRTPRCVELFLHVSAVSNTYRRESRRMDK